MPLSASKEPVSSKLGEEVATGSIIAETSIVQVVRRPRKWLKPSLHRLEAQGGIFVLWKSKDISVDVLQDDSQFVHMKVVQEKKRECLLIALYAKPMESPKAWI
ncbi:hypothetical protein RYX36_000979 [Vicia faba]